MAGMEWIDDARAAAQAQIDAPLVAVGFLQPSGSWGSLGTSVVSGAAGSLTQRWANRKAGGLAKAGGFKPKLAMLATTAGEIHVFVASPARGRTVKVGDRLATWRRMT